MKSIRLLLLAALFPGMAWGVLETSTPGGGGWMHHPEFGWYYPTGQETPAWLFHADHGWIYWTGSGSWEDGTHAYGEHLEWLWMSGPAHPWIWLETEGIWREVYKIRLAPQYYLPIDDAALLAGKAFASLGLYVSEAPQPIPLRLFFGPRQWVEDSDAYIFIEGDALYEGNWSVEDGQLIINGTSVSTDARSWNPWAQLLWVSNPPLDSGDPALIHGDKFYHTPDEE